MRGREGREIQNRKGNKGKEKELEGERAQKREGETERERIIKKHKL